MTYSFFAFSSRPFCSCSHEQIQAQVHVHADHVSTVCFSTGMTMGSHGIRHDGGGALEAAGLMWRTWIALTINEKR